MRGRVLLACQGTHHNETDVQETYVFSNPQYPVVGHFESKGPACSSMLHMIHCVCFHLESLSRFDDSTKVAMRTVQSYSMLRSVIPLSALSAPS
jgi:hypothetical protein